MEIGVAVAAALAKLPEEYRTVVTPVDIEDRSYATAAESVGVPVGTLRPRLLRGRRLRQRELDDFAQDARLLPAMKKSKP